MLGAVEPLPDGGVGQAEVGAAVDDHGVLPQLGGDGAGLAVGQAEEDDVVTAEGLGAGLLEHPVGQRHEVGLEDAEALTGVGAAREGADLDVGVGQEQPEDLAPGIAAGARDGDACG